ncbi:MAG: hypothetical protein U0946_00825 [Patescibacteria group bacterium]|nr:hypothetical protein [Patescibacteria group bacterium]
MPVEVKNGETFDKLIGAEVVFKFRVGEKRSGMALEITEEEWLRKIENRVGLVLDGNEIVPVMVGSKRPLALIMPMGRSIRGNVPTPEEKKAIDELGGLASAHLNIATQAVMAEKILAMAEMAQEFPGELKNFKLSPETKKKLRADVRRAGLLPVNKGLNLLAGMELAPVPVPGADYEETLVDRVLNRVTESLKPWFPVRGGIVGEKGYMRETEALLMAGRDGGHRNGDSKGKSRVRFTQTGDEVFDEKIHRARNIIIASGVTGAVGLIFAACGPQVVNAITGEPVEVSPTEVYFPTETVTASPSPSKTVTPPATETVTPHPTEKSGSGETFGQMQKGLFTNGVTGYESAPLVTTHGYEIFYGAENAALAVEERTIEVLRTLAALNNNPLFTKELPGIIVGRAYIDSVMAENFTNLGKIIVQDADAQGNIFYYDENQNLISTAKLENYARVDVRGFAGGGGGVFVWGADGLLRVIIPKDTSALSGWSFAPSLVSDIYALSNQLSYGEPEIVGVNGAVWTVAQVGADGKTVEVVLNPLGKVDNVNELWLTENNIGLNGEGVSAKTLESILPEGAKLDWVSDDLNGQVWRVATDADGKILWRMEDSAVATAVGLADFIPSGGIVDIGQWSDGVERVGFWDAYGRLVMAVGPGAKSEQGELAGEIMVKGKLVKTSVSRGGDGAFLATSGEQGQMIRFEDGLWVEAMTPESTIGAAIEEFDLNPEREYVISEDGQYLVDTYNKAKMAKWAEGAWADTTLEEKYGHQAPLDADYELTRGEVTTGEVFYSVPVYWTGTFNKGTILFRETGQEIETTEIVLVTRDADGHLIEVDSLFHELYPTAASLRIDITETRDNGQIVTIGEIQFGMMSLETALEILERHGVVLIGRKGEIDVYETSKEERIREVKKYFPTCNSDDQSALGINACHAHLYWQVLEDEEVDLGDEVYQRLTSDFSDSSDPINVFFRRVSFYMDIDELGQEKIDAIKKEVAELQNK